MADTDFDSGAYCATTSDGVEAVAGNEILTCIFSADGTLGRPGIVMMSPVLATRKPAPALTLRSRTVILKPRGAPSLLASSVPMRSPPSSCASCATTPTRSGAPAGS